MAHTLVAAKHFNLLHREVRLKIERTISHAQNRFPRSSQVTEFGIFCLKMSFEEKFVASILPLLPFCRFLEGYRKSCRTGYVQLDLRYRRKV